MSMQQIEQLKHMLNDIQHVIRLGEDHYFSASRSNWFIVHFSSEIQRFANILVIEPNSTNIAC
jgi:hypothetical protein